MLPRSRLSRTQVRVCEGVKVLRVCCCGVLCVFMLFSRAAPELTSSNTIPHSMFESRSRAPPRRRSPETHRQHCCTRFSRQRRIPAGTRRTGLVNHTMSSNFFRGTTAGVFIGPTVRVLVWTTQALFVTWIHLKHLQQPQSSNVPLHPPRTKQKTEREKDWCLRRQKLGTCGLVELLTHTMKWNSAVIPTKYTWLGFHLWTSLVRRTGTQNTCFAQQEASCINPLP